MKLLIQVSWVPGQPQLNGKTRTLFEPSSISNQIINSKQFPPPPNPRGIINCHFLNLFPQAHRDCSFRPFELNLAELPRLTFAQAKAHIIFQQNSVILGRPGDIPALGIHHRHHRSLGIRWQVKTTMQNRSQRNILQSSRSSTITNHAMGKHRKMMQLTLLIMTFNLKPHASPPVHVIHKNQLSAVGFCFFKRWKDGLTLGDKAQDQSEQTSKAPDHPKPRTFLLSPKRSVSTPIF